MGSPHVLDSDNYSLPTSPWHIWRRIRRFLRISPREKVLGLRRRFPFLKGVLSTVRLDYGAKWCIREDHVSQPILRGEFEPMEISFEQRFLRPGMTVLDIGAHHGYHTLLASLRVGNEGKVFAFEPSDRERAALVKNLTLNRCQNVTVESLALGAEDKSAELHVVSGIETGCNSLAPPNASGGTSSQTVRVKTLDEWLQTHRIDRVDFVKLDVEGGERDVLAGAERLTAGQYRPVVLAEVQEIRTAPWGYRAKVVIDHLAERGFIWLSLRSDGFLAPLDVSAEDYDGNFVACPEERLSEVNDIIVRDTAVATRFESVWVDVGAHLGERTIQAAISNPNLLVFAFEPNWKAACRIMGRAANYVVLPMAVSDSDGSADFFVNSNEESSSLAVMEQSGLAHWRDIDLSVAEQRTVPTIRLDTFMQRAGLRRIDYLKIDAEGMDLNVVRSAGERLKDIRKIMLEVDVAPDVLYRGAPRRSEVVEFMVANGFILTGSESQSSGRQENLTFTAAVREACQSSR